MIQEPALEPAPQPVEPGSEPAAGPEAASEPATPDRAPAGDDAPADSAAPEGVGELVPWLQSSLNREFEIVRRVPAVELEWKKCTIDRRSFVAPAGGGIYIVVENDAPLYVGSTNSFAKRWANRLRALHQIGLTGAEGSLPKTLTVYFGKLLPPGVANNVDALRAVEHVVIRAFLRTRKLHPLRNVMSVSQLRVKEAVTVRNVLPPPLLGKVAGLPGLSGSSLSLRPDLPFEIAAERGQ